jgi:nitrogen fixation/metabolism regulation signal transduction histidine kinase
MEEIEVAIFAFDDAGRLRLVNPRGEALLALPAERALGATAASLGLTAALEGETPRMIELSLAGHAGRWEVRRGSYRWEGRPHELVVLADLTRSLREEERVAWQRLIRVLSHEINNSLAPIRSLAGTLTSLLDRQPRAPDAEADLRRGLDVIATRAESLNRFMASYARLARLPPPVLGDVSVDAWVERVAGLEAGAAVTVVPGPEVVLRGDGDQLDQLLINLLKNALEAVQAAARGIGWAPARLAHGRGVGALTAPGSGGANLFMPFFTTSPAVPASGSRSPDRGRTAAPRAHQSRRRRRRWRGCGCRYHRRGEAMPGPGRAWPGPYVSESLRP